MANKRGIQNTSQVSTNTFIKGLNKDSDPSFIEKGQWTHARNAVNNTLEGDLGTLSNESSNFLCALAGDTLDGLNKLIIGNIHLFSDKWLIFTTSEQPPGIFTGKLYEIGLFEEDTCKYRIIVQDNCLKFNKYNLITGASREKEDCSWAGYFADGLNPDRYLNIGDPQTWPADDFVWASNNQYTNGIDTIQWPGVQWIEDCNVDALGCNICVDTQNLDCDKLRLARLVKTPCLTVTNGAQGGTLRNGSYFAVLAYTIKQQKVTDYYSPSNVQPIFIEDDFRGALHIEIEADSENFDEFELVVIQNINQGAVAKRIGIYSTKTTVVYLDQIKESLTSIDLNLIPISNPIIEKSDQIVEVNGYLLRVGPTSRFDFNYQPLANLIQARWASVEYPNDYYVKGGSNTSYLRDENYSFFIRWIYNTGDKSSSYHIPGRHPEFIPNLGIFENSVFAGDQNSLIDDDLYFETYNTASGLTYPGTTLPDGGIVVATGKMGFWQSTEIYPDNRPDIWNSSEHCWTGVTQSSINYDLCGLPIRHHKFPDNALNQFTSHFDDDKIRIMGVSFENIIYPKDNDGNDIPGIVGYEILRGSREGNKTIIAKGMINNLRRYNILDEGTILDGLYPNYPFNTIEPSKKATDGTDITIAFDDPYIKATVDDDSTLHISNLPKDVITFHSPDTSFKKPLLATTELKLYGHLQGRSTQQFIEPSKHPEHKLLGNITLWAAIVGGIIEAIIANLGKRTLNQPGASFTRVFGDDYTQQAIGGGGGTSGSTGTIPGVLTAGNISANTGNDGSTEIVEYSDDSAVTGGSGVDAVFNSGLEEIYAQALEEYFNNGTAVNEGINTALGLSPGTKLIDIYSDFNLNAGQTAGGTYTAPEVITELSKNQYIKGNIFLSTVVGNAGNLIYYFAEGFDLVIRLVYALLPYRQYALQMIGHGFYDTFIEPYNVTRKRFNINDEFYLKDNIQDMRGYQPTFGAYTKYKINNLKRSKTIVLRTTGGKTEVTDGPRFIGTGPGPASDIADDSLVTLKTAIESGSTNLDFKKNNTKQFSRHIASHYAGIKVRIQNQYGQLETIKQVPATPCEQKFEYDDILPTTITPANCPPFEQRIINSTPVIFGGDTYINRYTEKNSMMFFYDWLYDQPDGFYFNYFLRKMIPEPRFWMNTEKYEGSDLWTNLVGLITGTNPPGSGLKPSDFYQLDNEAYDYTNDNQGQPLIPLPGGMPGTFGVKQSFMYLAASGVRDFYVESDVIVDFREAGDETYQKNYDPYGYTDLTAIFDMNPNVITRGNYFRYDYSLSISKLFTQYFSQGNLQTRNYNPIVSELCYTYYPDRIYYSLPQQIESTKDNWFIYLPNNYKEFKSQISGVKNFAKTGIFITFKNDSPLIFQGTDTLQTDLGTKVTIGDGGLFAQSPQNVVVSDAEYEYGSSQNRMAVISSPAGMYYVSQNQGKVFAFAKGLQEISSNGLKWWFNKFMPYKLTEDFPTYPYNDNPVAGIGIHATYDNKNGIIYFAKKDYRLKPEYKGRVIYNEILDSFVVDGVTRLRLGNSTIFEDASWTISYDPKAGYWVSHHDWHPDLFIAGKGNFLTTKGNGIWKHNSICNDYCHFYGVTYPFEIEFPISTGQTVTTMRSIEYMLECYKRDSYNCVDQFHVLDYNFDTTVIHNSEQVSGYLNLNPYPKNNISLNLTYPRINFDSIDILCSKEENKYRFNQFWDITKDRGEFPVGSRNPTVNPVIPGTTVQFGGKEERNIWVTESNGYIKALNDFNLSYSKESVQRKKFRHYNNMLFLRKDASRDVNMVLKISNTKNQISLR